MKTNRPKKLVNLFVVLALALSLLTAMAGCSKQEDTSKNSSESTVGTTMVPTTEDNGEDDGDSPETVTVLKKLSISNGDYFSYDYNYEYDFDKNLLTVTAKDIPAGDEMPKECFTWFFTNGILKGETLESIPDITGASEEFTLWAQPLTQSGDILNYKLILYEEESEDPITLTYKFTQNSKGQVSTLNINYSYPNYDEYNWDAVVKYRYDDDGYLIRVSETSENRDLVWEFNRDENHILTDSTLQDTFKDSEAIDTYLSMTHYNYDGDGTLVSMTVKGEEDEYSYTTKYIFSETTDRLSVLEDDYSRYSFYYDDSLTRLTQVKSMDTETGTSYFTMEYTYADVEK